MSRNSVRLFSLVFVLAAGVFASASAQELEIAVSPSPVGSGARAAGMADAFVAIADDATAASWNPAGLVQLERPEFSLVGSWNGVWEKFGAKFHPEFDSRHHSDNYDLNYFSFVYPVPRPFGGRNMSLALNYQRKYDFTRKFRADFNSADVLVGSGVLNSFLDADFLQHGGLSTITPAFAIELTHRLSVGASLNLWRSSFLSENGWTQKTSFQTTSVGVGSTVRQAFTRMREEYEDFRGENWTFGVLWSVNDKWSVGARYDTAFTGDVDYEARGSTIRLRLPSSTGPPMLSVAPTWFKEKRQIRFPPTWAVGAAYRRNDKLTFSMDVTSTDWNEFYVKDRYGRRNSLVDFGSRDNPLTKTDFDRTYTVRVGFEYVLLPRELEERLDRLWTIRGGVFYDQEPATGKPRGFRLLNTGGSGKPDEFYGAAFGVGVLLNQRVNIDAAYQIRYGPGVNADFIRGVPGFEEDVLQHRFLLSTVVYF